MTSVTPLVRPQTALLREIAQTGDRLKRWVLVAEDEHGDLMIPDGEIDVSAAFGLLSRAAITALRQVQEEDYEPPEAS